MNRKRKRTSEPEVPLQLPGSPEDEEYPMDYKNRGKCYIFNHEVFSTHTKLDKRDGTKADALSLKSTFDDLGFHVEIFHDFTIQEVHDALEKAGKEDHSDSSCFVCCVLSHGENGYLFAKDGMYHTENMFAHFRGDVCPTLVGKPKLFFIQACQGDKLVSGVDVTYQTDSFNLYKTNFTYQFKIPTHADFLVAYSTIPGFASIRLPNKGSWFIQTLCEALKKYAKTKDIIQILTIVNREVAFNFEINKPEDDYSHKKKQVPLITSTLTRDLKFY